MTRKYSRFEEEVVQFVVWQLKGFQQREVPESATRRMLRAALEGRRMSAPVMGRSAALETDERGELDHVVPRSVVVDLLLQVQDPTSESVKAVIETYLVMAEVTASEHREKLKPWAKRMPEGWDPIRGDRLARYSAAGITLRV